MRTAIAARIPPRERGEGVDGATTRYSTRKPYLFARKAISSSQPPSLRRDSVTAIFALAENAASWTAGSGSSGTRIEPRTRGA
jgi:hypothetical protein